MTTGHDIGATAPETAPELVEAAPPTSSPPTDRVVPPRQAVARRVPHWSEIRPLLQFEAPEVSAARRRLRRAVTIEDLREAARHRVPRSVFEFVDGGAEDELTL